VLAGLAILREGPATVTSRLLILSTVTTAYSDVGRALSTMRTLAVSVLFIILAINVVEDLVPMRVWAGPVLGGLLSFAVDAVRNFCVTPFMMAIHRFILRGEVTRGYAPDPGQPGFMAFFGWLVALSAIGAMALLLQDIFSLLPVIGLVIALTIIIAVAVLTLRLSILFPAIAIVAPGANAANAMADTKGHAFTIFLIFLLAMLPVMVVTIGVTLMLGRGVAVPGRPAAIIHLAVGAVIQAVALSLGVAIASRIFQALADHVLRAD
jgi:hypothetical protein